MKIPVTIGILAVLLSTAHSATIVNVDFNGIGQGDLSSAGTAVIQGSAGGGTFFNGITADSSTGNYALKVTTGALKDSNGGSTNVTFSINDVGGDHNLTDPLAGDYLYNNDLGSGGNNGAGIAGSAFTIAGLGSATTADIYLYSPSGGDFLHTNLITTAGLSSGGAGTYKGLSATLYTNVVVTNGSISGAFGTSPGDTFANQYNILDGFTIVYTSAAPAVPEPSTYALLVCGFAALVITSRVRKLSKV